MGESEGYFEVTINAMNFDVNNDGELVLGLTPDQAKQARDEINSALDRYLSMPRTGLKIETTADGFVGLHSFVSFFVEAYNDERSERTASRLFRKIVQLAFTPSTSKMYTEHIPFEVRCRLCGAEINMNCEDGERHPMMDVSNLEVSIQSLRDNDMVFREGQWSNIGSTTKSYWNRLLENLS